MPERSILLDMVLGLAIIFLTLSLISPALTRGLRSKGIQWLFLFLALIFLMLHAILLSMYTRRREEEKIAIKTIIKCTKCNYTCIRDFSEGDYVLKVVGKCKCGGNLFISAIFNDVESKE